MGEMGFAEPSIPIYSLQLLKFISNCMDTFGYGSSNLQLLVMSLTSVPSYSIPCNCSSFVNNIRFFNCFFRTRYLVFN
jgi:hypothetical protein